MEAAANSEALAEQYKNEAFAGTPEGYAALVNQVGLLDIATSTGNTLYNTAPGGYRLTELVGATEQKTLSGKNLLNVAEIVSFDHEYVPVKLKAGTYHVTCSEVTSDGNNGVYIVLNTTPYKLTSGCDRTVTLTEDYSTTVGLYSNGYDYAGSEGITATIKQLMISVEGGDYEPYCGGIPSPNPDYTQAIENTFDCVKMIQGYYGMSNGVFTNSVNSVCVKRKIPCKSSDTISLEFEKASDVRIVFFNGDTYISYIITNTLKEYSFQVPSGVNYFIFSFSQDGKEITPSTVGKITLTVNGKYVGQIVTSDDNGNEKVATFFLNEPMRKRSMLYKENGLYKAAHCFGEHEVNVTSIGTMSNGNKSVIVTPTNKRQVSLGNALCTHATYKQLGYTDGTFYENPVNFVLCGSADDTLETMQAKYNGAILMYELATPTIEVLDTESQIALNSLETFDGVTYIEVDSKIPPTSISGKYGTSEVGALALENANLRDTLNITTVKGSVANNLTTTEEGFVLDARMGNALDTRLENVENVLGDMLVVAEYWSDDSIELVAFDTTNVLFKFTPPEGYKEIGVEGITGVSKTSISYYYLADGGCVVGVYNNTSSNMTLHGGMTVKVLLAKTDVA